MYERYVTGPSKQIAVIPRARGQKRQSSTFDDSFTRARGIFSSAKIYLNKIMSDNSYYLCDWGKGCLIIDEGKIVR